MPNEENRAHKAASHIMDKFGYVVISILPSANSVPAGTLFYDYGAHMLNGWVLRVTHKTRQPDFERQVRELEDAALIRPGSYVYGQRLTNNRFFRCLFEIDADYVPF